MSLREHFGAPWCGRTHASMLLSLGLLAPLGVEYMGGEWSESLAVWSYGREPPWLAALPRACVALAGLASTALALGYRRRAAGVAFCAAFAALYALAPVAYHNNLYLLWLYVLLATVAVSRAPSPWRLVTDPGASPPDDTALFPRLVRWQVAVVYLGSALVKLTHPLWQGTGGVIRWLTLTRVPALNQGLLNPLLGPALAHPAASAALDAATIALEALLPLLLFAPRWRRAGIALGVALHLFMQEWLYPQLFTFLMLWSYQAFVPSGDRAWRATYSPSSRFDVALACVYPRIDWLGRVAWSPGDALSLTTPEGRMLDGVAALPWLTVLSPATLLLFALVALAAPGTRQVFTLPRDAVENVLVLAWASLWVPGLWSPVLARLRAPRTRL